MASDPIVIVSAARTPMGAFQGELKGFSAPELGAAAIRAAVERAKVKAEEVQEVRVPKDQVRREPRKLGGEELQRVRRITTDQR